MTRLVKIKFYGGGVFYSVVLPSIWNNYTHFFGHLAGVFFLQRGVSFFLINHVESTSRSSKRKGGDNHPPPPQQYPNSKHEL